MKKVLTCIWGLFLMSTIQGQEMDKQSGDTLRIVFYNTENFYDSFNDSLTLDDDFLPGEPRAWGYKKFRAKVINISRALIASGRWQKPGLIGLCEVENSFVLKQLTTTSPLKKSGYKIIHEESPDPRGVDVALLYDPGQFQPLYHRAIAMKNQVDTGFRTRDILYSKGLIFGTDTLHVFVNHWPSKYGGLASSLEKRKFVALKLRTILDSLLNTDPETKILLMGDFNDGADQDVMLTVLRARSDTAVTSVKDLINLMLVYRGNSGSHKYKGEWSTLDQIMVSQGLTRSNTRVSVAGAMIVNDDFLMEPDESYSGHKPFRTYSGPRYLGGYSDHLPVRVDLIQQH